MRTRHWPGTFVLALVAACGGGGGGGDTASPPTANGLTIGGTAVRGAALAGATVQVKCSAGTGSATTAADGTFTVNVTNGTLPCVLEVPLPGGGTLHSAIGGSGNGSVTANISPLTELILASAAGVDPQTLFNEFAQRQAAVTPAALTAAVAQVIAQLAPVVDITGSNPLTANIVIGQGLDAKIDALNTALANTGTTLQDLTQAALSSSPAQPAPPNSNYDQGTSATASVAAEVQLKPPAQNCAALRSGDYRVVSLSQGADNTDKVSLDAETLVVTGSDGTTTALTAVGPCRYSLPGGGEAVVSPAGVLAIRGLDAAAGNFRTRIAFPQQSHGLGELTGTWNYLGQASPTNANFRVVSGELVFDGAGKITSARNCNDLKTCADASAAFDLTLVANATGGWNMQSAGVSVGRIFQFRAGGGASMLLAKFDNGSYSFLTRPRTNGLPTAGAQGRSWNLGTSTQLLSSGIVSESGNTIGSVDAATQTFTRDNIIGTAGATVLETLHANQPRDGYTLRDANASAPTSAGGTAAVREFVTLSLRGMGLTPVAFADNNNLTLSVNLPPNIAWVAAEMINKPAAATCTALRSGTYRLIEARPVTPALQRAVIELVDFDATTLVATQGGQTDFTLVPVAGAPCKFKDLSGEAIITVSQAGVWVVQGALPDDPFLYVAFPEQTHTVAELQGTWNKLALQSPNAPGPFFVDAATITFDAAGTSSSALYCADVATCQTLNIQTTITADAGGGFTRASPGELSDRLFAYRAGNGDLMMVNVDGIQVGSTGEIGFWTQQRVNALPTVGTRNASWDVLVDPTTLQPSVSDSVNAIFAVDSTTQVVTRLRKTSGGATYFETVTVNSPRDGYNRRAGGSVTASDGSGVPIREFTSLSLRGMGFSVLKYVNGPNPTVMVSVGRP